MSPRHAPRPNARVRRQMHDRMLEHESARDTTALRARLPDVRDAWRRLLVERCGFGTTLPDDLLIDFLETLAVFVANPDPAIPIRLAAEWREMVSLSVEGVAATASAIGLVGEALRDGLDRDSTPGSAPADNDISTLLSSFTTAFSGALMTSGEFQCSESYWYGVSCRLTQERERRITQLAILNDVSTALASTLSLDQLATIIHEQCGRLFDATNFYIATLDGDSDEMNIIYHHFGGQRVSGDGFDTCLLYTSPSPRDRTRSRMPSSA